jgi:hypothetical protein
MCAAADTHPWACVLCCECPLLQVKLNRGGQKGDSFSSSKDMMDSDTSAAVAAAAAAAAGAAAPELQQIGLHSSGTPDSDTRQQLTGPGGLVPVPHKHEGSAADGSGGVHGSGGAIQWANSGDVSAAHGSGGVQGIAASISGARGSGGTVGYDVSTFSTAQHLQQFPTGANRGSRSTAVPPDMEERFNSVSALLKARSDVAVLRDLKIGPLLGRGSYGRVYRGEPSCILRAGVKLLRHETCCWVQGSEPCGSQGG